MDGHFIKKEKTDEQKKKRMRSIRIKRQKQTKKRKLVINK